MRGYDPNQRGYLATWIVIVAFAVVFGIVLYLISMECW